MIGMGLRELGEKILGTDERFLEEEMSSEEATPLAGSLTNDLVETQVGTVLKQFKSKPTMAYIQMAGRSVSGEIEFQDQSSRIANERNFRGFISDYEDVHVPDILGTSEEFVEYEQVDGQNLNTYLNSAERDEAVEMGLQVGEFLNYVHGKEGAITDLRINNFMLGYDGVLKFVDAEYFTENASDWEKRMDLITMVSSLKQVDGESYRGFREGFRESYSGDLDRCTGVISSATSVGHSVFIERDTERIRNALENIGNDVSEYQE